MNDLSFKARIRPVSISEFTKATSDIYGKASVNYPWTAKETITAPKAFTTDVFDCTAGGIVNETTKEVTLFHICPTRSENYDFNEIEQHIINQANLKDDSKYKGFLLGAQGIYDDSKMLFKKIK